MLKLIYDPVARGAPSQYGSAEDTLTDGAGSVLQRFRKADQDFAAPDAPLSDAVRAWLAARGPNAGPVIVLVHGYQYNPVSADGLAHDTPFQLVYGVPPTPVASLSWLPLVGECSEVGAALADTAIGFAYRSEAPLGEVSRAGWTNSYQYAVFDLAPLAARALAALLSCLAEQGATVRVLAHSLGTRTFAQAIRLLRARVPIPVERAVLLHGAEFSVDAGAAFRGCDFDVFNIANRKDAVLRIGASQLCHPMRANGSASACVIGFDGLGGNPRWLDLQADRPDLVAWFAAGNAPGGRAYRLTSQAEDELHPAAGLDHWCCYTNAGNRELVRDLLLEPAMTVDQFRARHVPDGVGSPSYGQFA
ncbi:MAG: hypothetical protein J0H57_11155, partial [Rhodospirillales bacterium]|nr:hypothetical protein [Rhodospirillales bacterium]